MERYIQSIFYSMWDTRILPKPVYFTAIFTLTVHNVGCTWDIEEIFFIRVGNLKKNLLNKHRHKDSSIFQFTRAVYNQSLKYGTWISAEFMYPMVIFNLTGLNIDWTSFFIRVGDKKTFRAIAGSHGFINFSIYQSYAKSKFEICMAYEFQQNLFTVGWSIFNFNFLFHSGILK